MYYSNGFPTAYDELITFYPVFYRDVYEMDAILRANGKLADDLVANIDSVINNNFIRTADEATISRLEAFLWLTTNHFRTLDERKRLVYSFFVGFGKMSASKIMEIMTAFTDTPATVAFEPGDADGNNYLSIYIKRGTVERLFFGDIDTILTRRIPAHLPYKLYVTCECATAVVKTGAYCATGARIRILPFRAEKLVSTGTSQACAFALYVRRLEVFSLAAG
jgi:hypothetical protein